MELKDLTLSFGVNNGPLQQINRELNEFNKTTAGASRATQSFSSQYQREQRKMIKETQATNDALGRQSREMRQLAKTAGASAYQFADDWADMSVSMRKDLIKNNNALVGHRREIRNVEHDMWKLSSEMGNYSGTNADFMKSVQDLGKEHKKATDKMINNNIALRKSIVQQVGVFQARSTQSEKITKAYDDMGSAMLKLNKPFLKVSGGLNNIAKQGNAATMALKQLGPNANMKALQDRIQLINRGMMRYQMVALAALAASALFYSGLHKAARDSIPAYAAAFDEMASSVRQAFQPMVEVFSAVMTKVYKFIDTVADLVIRFNEAYPMLAKVIQGFMMLIPVLTLILAPMAVGIGLFAGMKVAMASMWPVIGPLVTGLGAMLGTVLAVAAGIAIFVGAFVAAYKHLDGFRNRVDNVVQGIKGFFAIIRGEEGKGVSMLSRLGMDTDTIKGIVSFGSSIRSTIDQVKSGFSTLKSVGQSALAVFNGNNGKAVSILARLGFGPQTIKNLISTFETIKTTVASGLDTVWGFVKNIINKVTSFWDENGAMIIQSIKNVAMVIGAVLKGVWATMKFIWPVISALIKSVWGNIKGVISGALDFIMGAVKFFSGLFTGNFSKMWEGIKQMFSGAIRFIWNFIQLQMFGKILGAGKAFFSGFRSIISSLWTTIKKLFTKGVNSAKNFVSKGFTRMLSVAKGLFKKLKESVSNTWDDIVKGAKALPGKIGQGIKNMAGKAWEGIKAFGNRLARGFGKIINGALGGIGWIMGKLGISWEIPKWTPPEYAKGTPYHPGGPAILGDGGMQELYKTPAGQVGLSPASDTLMNLPKGTQVINGKDTQKILSANQMAPAYAKGNVFTNTISKGASWLKSKAGDAIGSVKNIALDVWDYMKNPSKLVSSVLNRLGVSFPSMDGALGQMGTGAFTLIKDKIVDFVDKKMKETGGPVSFGDLVKTSSFGMRFHPILKKYKLHAGDDYGGAVGTAIRSQSAGRVIHSGPGGSFGNLVKVQRGIYTHFYAHLQRAMARVGSMVSRGDVLGTLGSTGRSTGPHLHYEVRKNGVPIPPNRGYANGGVARYHQSAQLAENGWKEYVIPTQPSKRKRANNLLGQANNELGYNPSIDESHNSSGGKGQIVFSPQFVVNIDTNAKVDQEVIAQLKGLFKEMSEEQFESLINRLGFHREG
ncbi:peptidoglycan DD-metalloendopeptidase family protein [Halobacillus litoralis]|uniref:M23ase beta-sheet core domain-containing protein n=1 Tax=Halobacillus litoralis TaxID=45668 RepID=A0A410MDQ0_9BACI|nr:peptidoglycan DD-metalloendopeptidase family protein [Halobacillus litoralis]QAS52805.1 hypothetical protein HLI_11660 [Halobacillus litoralis]